MDGCGHPPEPKPLCSCSIPGPGKALEKSESFGVLRKRSQNARFRIVRLIINKSALTSRSCY
eukprot:5375958-Pyramimonas_sp.AAC.1